MRKLLLLSAFVTLLISCQDETATMIDELEKDQLEKMTLQSAPLLPMPPSGCIQGDIRPCVGGSISAYTCSRNDIQLWTVSSNACIQMQQANSITVSFQDPRTQTTIKAWYDILAVDGFEELTFTTGRLCGIATCDNI